MKVDGVTITWVSADESVDLRDRPDFIDVCCYDQVKPEHNEVGAIVTRTGNPHLKHGMWVTPCRYVERFFIVEPEAPC